MTRTRTIMSEPKRIISFEEPITSADCGFAFTRLKLGNLNDLMSRYINSRQAGLYAIVIPSGGGKTTKAAEFMQLDVDLLLPRDQEEELRSLRSRCYSQVAAGASKTVWAKHNLVWGGRLAQATSRFNFSAEPRVVFCHSPEIAMVMGAELLGIFVPEESLHRELIKDRSAIAQEIGIKNRDMLISTCRGSDYYSEYGTCDELGRMCARTMSTVGYFPGVGKYLDRRTHLMLIRNHKYADELPNHILSGVYYFKDLDMLVEGARAGKLPWWHVALWTNTFAKGLHAYEGVYDMVPQWLALSSDIQRAVASVAYLEDIQICHVMDRNFDWTVPFPYCDKPTYSQAGVTLRSLFRNLKMDVVDDYLLTILNAHIGSHHSFVVCVVVYYLGVVKGLSPTVRDTVVSSRMLEVPENLWVPLHKELHNLVRTTSTLFGSKLKPDEFTNLQYTPALHGRRSYKMDADSEILKRKQVRLPGKFTYSDGFCQESYITDFERGVEKAYARICTRRTESWSSYAEFFKKRYQWAAGGSVTNVPSDMKHMKDAVDLVVDVKSAILTLTADANKKTAMEQMRTPAELAHYLIKHHGYNVTSLAPKPNEPAKQRVLLPGSLLHYICTTFILGQVERTGDVGAVRVGSPEDNRLSHFDMRMAHDTANLMLDFADHNAQHSALEMSIIMKCLESKLQGQCNQEDLTFFMDWVVSGFHQMTILKPTGELESVVSGLFTGWRSTTWINSVACQAYAYVGCVIAERKYGTCEVEYFEGAGDDVLIRCSSPLTCFKFYDAMVMAGFEMQSIKQMISDKTEFLRVTGSKGSLGTCINRVMPNFVSGDLERSNPNLLDRAGGAYSTITMMSRRGLDWGVCSAMYKSYLNKWMRIKNQNDEYEDINMCLVHGLSSQGGLEIPDEHNLVWRLNGTIVWPDNPKPVIVNAPKYASMDAAEVMAGEMNRLGISLNTSRYAAKLADAVYSVALSKVDKGLPDMTGIKRVASLHTVAEVSPELLAMVLESVNSKELEDCLKQHARWSRFKAVTGCIDVSEDALARKLGVSIDYRAFDELSFPVSVAFSVPEYVLYNIGMYCRAMVGNRAMSPTDAIYCFVDCCATYREIFSNMRL